mgnify:CR=1 FL=1
MSNKRLKVLVACEYSGRVRDEFIALGHDAVSCDLLPTDVDGPHIIGDVLGVLDQGWDLMIAHPPCTYICNSGVCHLHKDASRWKKLDAACELFRSLLAAPIPCIAVENPIPHKYAVQRIGRKYDCLTQPYHHGEPRSKRTCFWLKGLSPLRPTNDVKAEYLALPKSIGQELHYLPPSKDRWKIRSTTYLGIAKAIAAQWGKEAACR